MAKRHKITIEVTDTVFQLLSVLGDPKNVLEQLTDHVQQGVYRPGAWERGWLEWVFPLEDWEDNIEPGDPYGRDIAGDYSPFCKPKAVS